MADESDRTRWHATRDHEEIRDVADEYDAVPVSVERSDGGRKPDLVADPSVRPNAEISWNRFFEQFDADDLVFRYRTAEQSGGDPEWEFVDRETRVDHDSGIGETEESPDAAADQIATSDTGGEEPVATDAVASDRDAPTEETSMSESAHGAELGALVLDEIHDDPELDADVEDEYLVFENTAEEQIDLSGCTVENEAGQAFEFPAGFELDPGERVTVHSSRGTDADRDLYWGADASVWDPTGDIVTVRAPDGTRLLREPYKS